MNRPIAVRPEVSRPSFETVYAGEFAYVWRLLRHFGVEDGQCEDAAQEVFVVVHRRLPEYEPRDKLRGWLGAIAFRVAAQVRRAEGPSMQIVSDPPDTSDDGFDLEALVTSADEVRQVLEGVRPDLRAVFVLRHFDDVPLEEIARHLDLKLPTAKTRLHQARAEVRAAWQRHQARERRTNVAGILGVMPFMVAGRTIPTVPSEVRARVWEGLQHRLAAPSPGRPGSDPEPSAPSARSASRVRAVRRGLGGQAVAARQIVRQGAALLVTLAVGIGIGAAWDPRHRGLPPASPAPSLPVENAVVQVQAPAAPPASAGETPVGVMPAEAPRPAPPPRPRPSGTSSPAASASVPAQPPDAERESAIIDRAMTAYGAGNDAEVLQLLEEHARVFRGGGRHAQDRDALWITALIRAGRVGEARQRLEGFEAAYPKSPRAVALRRALPQAER